MLVLDEADKLLSQDFKGMLDKVGHFIITGSFLLIDLLHPRADRRDQRRDPRHDRRPHQRTRSSNLTNRHRVIKTSWHQGYGHHRSVFLS